MSYTGADRRQHANTAMRMIIRQQSEMSKTLTITRDCTQKNGFKLDTQNGYIKRCETTLVNLNGRVTDLETDVAVEDGIEEGKSKNRKKLNNNVTLLSTVLVAMITIATFYCMTKDDNKSTELLLSKIQAIEQRIK